MVTLLIYMIVGALIVLFASQNLEAVVVHLIAGRPIDVPLIVVIGVSFVVGFISAILGVIRKVTKNRLKRSDSLVVKQ